MLSHTPAQLHRHEIPCCIPPGCGRLISPGHSVSLNNNYHPFLVAHHPPRCARQVDNRKNYNCCPETLRMDSAQKHAVRSVPLHTPQHSSARYTLRRARHATKARRQAIHRLPVRGVEQYICGQWLLHLIQGLPWAQLPWSARSAGCASVPPAPPQRSSRLH
jgi:hypothetical protein